MTTLPAYASDSAALGSAKDGFAVTPSDTVAFATMTRGLYVGGTGDVAVIMRSGAALTFSAVPAGTLLPIQASQVKATGTTASLILGLL